MGKIVITDSNSFEGEIHEFENALIKIKDIFESEKNNTIWTSMTQETIYNKKIEFEKNFNPIEEAIGTYIKFLKKTLEDYRRLEEITNRSMEDQASNLDVNS